MMRKCGKRVELLLGVFFSFFVVSVSLAKVETVLGNVNLKKNPNIAINPPTTSESEIIISRDQYVISYNKNRRNPNWVAWRVDDTELGNVGRTNNFVTDSDLEKYLKNGKTSQHAVKPTEYFGSCYDRGHQTPSADRSETAQDNEATFVMSNMLPQTPYLNRVVWMHLEQYTRDLVRKEGKIAYVVAGPIYDQDFGMIGPKNDIKVPSKNFKVILLLEHGQTPADINDKTEVIAVVMPNLLEDGSRPDKDKDALCKSSEEDQRGGRSNDWEQYKSTLADVQKLSGVTLFPK
jgi:endonuclease G